MPSGKPALVMRFSGVVEDELAREAEPGWFRVEVKSDGAMTLEAGARGQTVVNRQVVTQAGLLWAVLGVCFGRSQPD